AAGAREEKRREQPAAASPPGAATTTATGWMRLTSPAEAGCGSPSLFGQTHVGHRGLGRPNGHRLAVPELEDEQRHFLGMARLIELQPGDGQEHRLAGLEAGAGQSVPD